MRNKLSKLHHDGFTMQAPTGTSTGALAISVDLTGTATNIGSTPLTVASNAAAKLTVVASPNTVKLSADTAIVEGGVTAEV